MSRHAGPEDPDKGKPHRHTQAKIRLLLNSLHGDHLALRDVILALAEKRPEEVLGALADELEGSEEYEKSVTDFVRKLGPEYTEQLEAVTGNST